MAEITTALVKELRERTGAGMMDCKRALAEVGGRPRGRHRLAAQEGPGRRRQEGRPGDQRGPDRHDPDRHRRGPGRGQRRDRFRRPQRELPGAGPPDRALALQAKGDLEALKAAPIEATGRTVADEITQAIAVIGENINLRRTAYLEVAAGVVAATCTISWPRAWASSACWWRWPRPATGPLAELGKQLAMHVAATNPQAVSADKVDPAVVERERAIFADQARASGKPENIIEKMVEGRLRKFYEEAVLLEQAFVVDPDKRVKEAVQAAPRRSARRSRSWPSSAWRWARGREGRRRLRRRGRQLPASEPRQAAHLRPSTRRGARPMSEAPPDPGSARPAQDVGRGAARATASSATTGASCASSPTTAPPCTRWASSSAW